MTSKAIYDMMLLDSIFFIDILADIVDENIRNIPEYLTINRDGGSIMFFKPDKILAIKQYFKYTMGSGIQKTTTYGLIFAGIEEKSIAVITDTELDKIKKVLVDHSRYDILLKLEV